MPMTREKKEQEVKAYNDRFSKSGVVVLSHNEGLTVSQMTDYRAKLREAGASCKVVKNRLAKLALKGTEYEHLIDKFAGPVVVANSSDPVAAAKITQEFSKDNPKLKVVAGGLGQKELDAKAVEALSKLPSLDELRSTLLGMFQQPATKLARVLNAPGTQMALVLKAKADQGESA